MAPGPSYSISRREFLLSTGALVVCTTGGLRTDRVFAESAQTPKLIPSPEQLDSWIAILPDGSVEAFFGKMDVGQGIDVAIAQIVADELDVGLERVMVRMGDTATSCNQGGASGSSGVSLGGKPLRNAAAEARRLMLNQAAGILEVSADQLNVTDGVISASGSARQVTYAELVGGKHFNTQLEWNKIVGYGLDAKGHAKPKSPGEYRVVGTPAPRRDVAGKIFGTSDYVTDIRVPGMLHARMIRPPKAGSSIASVDTDSVKNAQVIRDREVLAVVSENEWDAITAARELKVQWNSPSNRVFPGADGLHDHIRNAPVVKREDSVKKGDLEAAFKRAARVVEAEYRWPLQSHASLGPACALVEIKDGEATLWTGTQKPHFARDGVAVLLGLPPEKVRGIWVMGPGSYGRNDAGDAALDAAHLAKLTGRPIRLQGMRADGTAWDPKGTATVHRARAALDATGKVIAYEYIVKGFSRLNVSYSEADPRDTLLGMSLGMEPNPGFGLGVPAESYSFDAKLLAWEVVPPLLDSMSPLRTAHMRDPAGPEVHFGSEQFIDELAAATHTDPVEFRLRYISDARDKAVVRSAAEAAGWTPRTAVGPRKRTAHAKVLYGRGIAYAQRIGTVVAVVVDLEVHPKEGRIWARRVTVAHDCGLIINPKTLHQVIEGNVVQGLSRTVFEEVRFNQDAVESIDWTSYPILEIQDAPESINIVLINNPDVPPGGAGEPTTRCIPAAVANAFYDATGVRIRRAPLNPARVKAALARA